MNTKISRQTRTTLLLAGFLASAAVLPADLIKDNNNTELGSVGAYTPVPTSLSSSDIIVFNNILTDHSSLSWTGIKNLGGIKMVNPSNAITISLSGASYALTGSAPIDMSQATQDLTITGTHQNALLRFNSATARFDVASGRTLTLAVTKMATNYSSGTGILEFTGAGTVMVSGSITDKSATVFTGITQSGTGTLTLAGANTYTGRTTVASGTVKVTGTLAATGALTVAEDATFLVANDITVGNTTFADGAILGFDLNAADGSSLTIAGNLTGDSFIIDFGGTGIVGETYSNLLSVTGTGADFGSVLFINFGAERSGGTLSATDLSGSFIGGVIPEPSTYAALFGLAVIAWAVFRRRA